MSTFYDVSHVMRLRWESCRRNACATVRSPAMVAGVARAADDASMMGSSNFLYAPT
jgi:hypothetical protein